MKLAMRLTLDGLVRAMRVKAHAMADEVESGARGKGKRVGAGRPDQHSRPQHRERRNDDRGRV
jgi:hypothetical protein